VEVRKSDTHQFRSGSQTPTNSVRESPRNASARHAGSRRWRRDDPRASGRCGRELIDVPARFCASSVIADQIGARWSRPYGM
jgi:hypothetical protein